MANAAQREKATIDLVINGQQSLATMKDLTAATTNARKALYSMAQTDPGYKAQEELLQKLMRAQQARIVKIGEEQTAWQKFKAGTGSIVAGVVGGNAVTAIGQTLLGSVGKIKDVYAEFNANSQELSAVTGATGKDLEYLNEMAAKTGPTVGKSGAEMLEAYKLMASAKPELLENKELLTQTTDAAITLSQAGKIALSEATSVTAESLNQFGEGADQANRFINVIAAGAKEGSAEINEMGAALKNSGTVAASQNVSFEQTNAMLQSLSTIAIKGGEAGTGLRNVLLTLGSGADEFNPKIVGMDKALENLGNKNMSTAELTKMFGKENVVAAQHLITHREQIEQITKKITGTGEAFSQAEKNNASFDHQMEIMGAKIEGYALKIGMKLAPAFGKVAEWGNKLLDLLPVVGEWLEKNGGWILSVVVPGLVAYQGAVIGATVATTAQLVVQKAKQLADELTLRWMILLEAASKAQAFITGVLTGQISLQTAATVVARTAWSALNAVMRANPIGVVVTAITALAWAVKLYSDNTKEALRIERDKIKLQEGIKKLTEQQTKAQAKYNELLNEYPNLTSKQRAELVKNIAMEKLHLESRLRSMKVQEKQLELLAAEPSLWQQLGAAMKAAMSGQSVAVVLTEQAVSNMQKIREQFQPGIDAVEQQVKGYDAMFDRIRKMETPSPKPAAGGGKHTPTKEEKKAAAAAKKEADKEKRDTAKDAEDLEKLLADARGDALKAEQSDYDKATTAFAEKYSKMYELAGTNTQKIQEIERLSLVEMAAIQKKFADEAVRKDRDLKARQLQEDVQGYEAELKLKNKAAQDQLSIDAKAGRITEGQQQTRSLDLEMQYLLARKAILQKHYGDVEQLGFDSAARQVEFEKDKKAAYADIEEQITGVVTQQVDNRIAQSDRFMQQSLEKEKARKEAIEGMIAAVTDVMAINWQEQIDGLKEFWQKATTMQKIAFVASKAYSAAEATMAYAKTLMNIWAQSKNPFAAAAFSALATATYTSVLSKIASANYTPPQFALGGFTDREPGGYVDGPTMFTQGNYVAGEKGREWIMSAPMLQNPVFANLAGAMQAMQSTGSYRNVRSVGDVADRAFGIGSDSKDYIATANTQVLQAILLELQQGKSSDNRPVVLNYRLLEDYQNEVVDIRTEATL